MIPIVEDLDGQTIGILHVCGDDPKNMVFGMDQKEYSPRMWR